MFAIFSHLDMGSPIDGFWWSGIWLSVGLQNFLLFLISLLPSFACLSGQRSASEALPLCIFLPLSQIGNLSLVPHVWRALITLETMICLTVYSKYSCFFKVYTAQRTSSCFYPALSHFSLQHLGFSIISSLSLENLILHQGTGVRDTESRGKSVLMLCFLLSPSYLGLLVF